MKKIIMDVFYILFCAIVLFMTVAGIYGNPSAESINQDLWKKGPFEFAQRARFALTYSFVEEKSLALSASMAKFALPDIGYKNGKYVSLFAPGTSFVTAPGYILGNIFGISQFGTYLVIAVFALLNTVLVRLISQKLGASKMAASVASFIFLFATPAFSYAVNLYQHHVSAFLLLSCVYLLVTSQSIPKMILVWFLYGVAVLVDYPNGVLMLPVVIYALLKILKIKAEENNVQARLNLRKMFTFLGLVPPILFLFWFNKSLFNTPYQLTGTVQDVVDIRPDGSPLLYTQTKNFVEQLKESQLAINKSALGFFNTRNLINGLYTHLVSPDRGIIYYTPVILFGLLGFSKLRRRGSGEFSLLTSIIGVNLILYSMWGDPWGGWSFGSRYLIPTYALMTIFIAVALADIKKNTLLLFLLVVITGYCVSVNSLGAVTASGNPPKVEAESLEAKSGQKEKYTFERNWDTLFIRGSESFLYNGYAAKYVGPLAYYLIVTTTLVIVLSSSLLSLAFFEKNEDSIK